MPLADQREIIHLVPADGAVSLHIAGIVFRHARVGKNLDIVIELDRCRAPGAFPGVSFLGGGFPLDLLRFDFFRHREEIPMISEG
jgi:hypothetical protein